MALFKKVRGRLVKMNAEAKIKIVSAGKDLWGWQIWEDGMKMYWNLRPFGSKEEAQADAESEAKRLS